MCAYALELVCDNGERVRVTYALDCCDRGIMSWVTTCRGINAELVGHFMMQAGGKRMDQKTSSPIQSSS